MWTDTHSHLDAGEFGGASDAIAQQSGEQGVSEIVIPAVDRHNFGTVRDLARRQPNCRYALGIHPICVPGASDDDLDLLRDTVAAAMDDPAFVAIGEIGLDYFLPNLCTPDMRARQEHFYQAQLKLARDFGLPVLLHVRRSQDIILKHLRRITVPGGIATRSTAASSRRKRSSGWVSGSASAAR